MWTRRPLYLSTIQTHIFIPSGHLRRAALHPINDKQKNGGKGVVLAGSTSFKALCAPFFLCHLGLGPKSSRSIQPQTSKSLSYRVSGEMENLGKYADDSWCRSEREDHLKVNEIPTIKGGMTNTTLRLAFSINEERIWLRILPYSGSLTGPVSYTFVYFSALPHSNVDYISTY